MKRTINIFPKNWKIKDRFLFFAWIEITREFKKLVRELKCNLWHSSETIIIFDAEKFSRLVDEERIINLNELGIDPARAKFLDSPYPAPEMDAENQPETPFLESGGKPGKPKLS